MWFEVRLTRLGSWELLEVIGDLDLATVPRLRQELDRVDGPLVAVDLSGVGHLDPMSFGVLLVGSLRAGRSGGRFAVVCPPGPARDLLDETGVASLFTVLDAVDELD